MSLAEQVKKLFRPNIPELLLSPFQSRLSKSRKALKSLRSKLDRRKSPAEKLADFMTSNFGSFSFLVVNTLWFGVWIFINLGYATPTIAIFDPYPFGLLTMIVSLEAIILSIFVLVSQNREQKINDLREEIDLEVDVVSESEITKVLEILVKIAKKNNIDLSKDEELLDMLKPLSREKISTNLEREILS